MLIISKRIRWLLISKHFGLCFKRRWSFIKIFWEFRKLFNRYDNNKFICTEILKKYQLILILIECFIKSVMIKYTKSTHIKWTLLKLYLIYFHVYIFLKVVLYYRKLHILIKQNFCFLNWNMFLRLLCHFSYFYWIISINTLIRLKMVNVLKINCQEILVIIYFYIIHFKYYITFTVVIIKKTKHF